MCALSPTALLWRQLVRLSASLLLHAFTLTQGITRVSLRFAHGASAVERQLERSEFAGRKRAVASGRKMSKLEIPDAYALHFFHRVAGLEELVAKRIATRLGQRHHVPGRILASQARDARAGRACQVFD